MSRYTKFEKAAVLRAKDAAENRPSTFGLIALLRKTVLADIKRAVRRAAIARELRELDARTLADIGVAPYAIDHLAHRIVAAESPKLPTTAEVLSELLARGPSAWLERRRVYNELMALDDRLLRDIGINRGDIEQIAYGAPRADETAVGGEAENVVQLIRYWNRSRAAARTLRSLDDRTLDDIGFVRGDIDWVSEELASRSVHGGHAHAA